MSNLINFIKSNIQKSREGIQTRRRQQQLDLANKYEQMGDTETANAFRSGEITTIRDANELKYGNNALSEYLEQAGRPKLAEAARMGVISSIDDAIKLQQLQPLSGYLGQGQIDNAQNRGQVGGQEGVSANIQQGVIPAGGTYFPESIKVGGQTLKYQPSAAEKESALQEKIRSKAMETSVVEGAKGKAKTKAAMSQAKTSMTTIGSAMNNLARTYVKGVKEGSMGNRLNATAAQAKLWAGGSVGDTAKSAGTYSGQVTEMITKMMPMLTQQGDKPGSVRLVSTVFDRLVQSLPELHTGPETAKSMMTATLTNMYSFANAVRRLGGMENALKEMNRLSGMNLTPGDLENMSDKELSTVANMFQGFADNITLTDQERKDLDSMLTTVLEPFNELRKDSGVMKTPSGITFSVKEKK